MNKAACKFDAVDMMRKSRDQISAAIDGMTLEQELAWLAAQKIDDPFLNRLRDKAFGHIKPVANPVTPNTGSGSKTR